jgi:beta-xylosidase
VRATARVAFVVGAVLAFSGCSGAPADQATVPRFAINQDFPDPDVLLVGGTYYAYSTNTPGTNVQVATSPDAKKWTLSGKDALPTLPDWTTPGKTWAPEVTELSPGRFVMYFTASNREPRLQCVNVAASDSPSGPFVASGTAALFCPEGEGGAIDAATFLDRDGQRFLVAKNDGNCCGLDTWLQLAPLSADGLSLEAKPRKVLKQGLAWEGILIEAPTLIRHGDRYFLFYSAGDYAGANYEIGYASATSVFGPYKKHPTPLLSTKSSRGRYTGPGGQDVVTKPDGSTLLVFHSWAEGLAFRGMNVLPLDWSGDGPVVKLP